MGDQWAPENVSRVIAQWVLAVGAAGRLLLSGDWSSRGNVKGNFFYLHHVTAVRMLVSCVHSVLGSH